MPHVLNHERVCILCAEYDVEQYAPGQDHGRQPGSAEPGSAGVEARIMHAKNVSAVSNEHVLDIVEASVSIFQSPVEA